MIKLRATTKKDIVNALDRSYFTAQSFDVKFNEEKSTFLEIIFLPITEFKFTASVNTSYGNKSQWKISEAPGIYLRQAEESLTSNFDEVVKSIDKWADRILEDYRHSKSQSFPDFSEFQSLIEKQVKETEDTPNELFSVEEADQIKSNLDELYKKFSELAKDNETLKKELATVKSQLEGIKGDTELFPKHTWYRVSGNKLIKILKKLSETTEVRQLVVEAVKKYLLGG